MKFERCMDITTDTIHAHTHTHWAIFCARITPIVIKHTHIFEKNQKKKKSQNFSRDSRNTILDPPPSPLLHH